MELASAIRGEVERALIRFSGWGESDVTRDRGAGKWGRKEILGHLIDSAANNHQRFVRAQLTSSFVGPGYDQQTWVSLHRYRERPWADLVALWVALNRHVAAVIERVPAEKLQTPCIIGNHESELLQLSRAVALTHHEKWNGKGYPSGLVGEGIPLAGRLTAIADIFDALTSVRPYKQAWSVDEALDWIDKEAGEALDPNLVPLFIAMRPEVEKIMQTFRDENK